jgi:RNA polymerase sigma-70 factor (ECF subfamily)
MGQVLFVHAEADLIEAARAGDGSAFAELVRPQYQAAFRVAYGMLHDIDEAEDEGASLRPWFLAIVANQCRTMSKSRWWSVLRVDPPETQSRSVDIAASMDLRRALRRLGHDERLVVVLRYYLDMPFEEIATMLGISTKAARTRVERAVRRLRPIIQNQGAAV